MQTALPHWVQVTGPAHALPRSCALYHPTRSQPPHSIRLPPLSTWWHQVTAILRHTGRGHRTTPSVPTVLSVPAANTVEKTTCPSRRSSHRATGCPGTFWVLWQPSRCPCWHLHPDRSLTSLRCLPTSRQCPWRWRTLTHMQRQGRQDLGTPTPATSQFGQRPSSTWNFPTKSWAHPDSSGWFC